MSHDHNAAAAHPEVVKHPRKPSLERWLEQGLFAARWLMAPFYVGLVFALVCLLVVFMQELWHGLMHITSMNAEEGILLALSLIDLSLSGNLLIIVIFSGYENFVSKIDTDGHQDRPAWMGVVDFSALKIKLIGSIVAISAIALLKAFLRTAEPGAPPIDEAKMLWLVVIHVAFVGSGVMLAAMDWITTRSKHH